MENPKGNSPVNDEPVNDANKDAQPKEIVALKIAILPSGALQITGSCINDKTIAFGLLECAKDEIRKAHEPKIVKPGSFLNNLRINLK